MLEPKTKAPQVTPGVQPGASKWFKRYSVVALLIFLAINTPLVLLFGEDKVSNDVWNGGGAVDLAVNGYKNMNEAPHMVLLGSSLMMYPFWAMDIEKDRGLGDIFHHRGSKVLTEVMNQNGIPNAEVYSMAMFAQMVSDGYIMVNEFLQDGKKPKCLLLGVAPRDFYDADLSAPTATYTFKRLIKLSNFWPYANHYLPGVEEKADWLCGKICYFYGHRWRAQKDVAKAMGKLFDRIGLKNSVAEKAVTKKSGFMLAGSEEERWDSSLNEYRRRYKGADEKGVTLQMSFLEKTLHLCHKRGIRVILVNMPITADNRNLLPDGFYKFYQQKLKVIAAANGTDFLDLGASSKFQRADFWDTTHLNHGGGHKLVQELRPLLR